MEAQVNHKESSRLQPSEETSGLPQTDNGRLEALPTKHLGEARVVESIKIKADIPDTCLITANHEPAIDVSEKIATNGPINNHQPSETVNAFGETVNGSSSDLILTDPSLDQERTVEEMVSATAVPVVGPTEISPRSSVQVKKELMEIPQTLMTDTVSNCHPLSVNGEGDGLGSMDCSSVNHDDRTATPCDVSGDIPEETTEDRSTTVFRSQEDGDATPSVSDTVEPMGQSPMVTDNLPVPSEFPNSNSMSDRSTIDINQSALAMTDDVPSEHLAVKYVQHEEGGSVPAGVLSTVIESAGEVSLADPPRSVESNSERTTYEQRTSTPDSESVDIPQPVKRKPRKLESILFNLKAKSVLSPAVAEEEVIPVEEPIPELPPGTVVVKPTDADVKKVRRKKYRKIKKHNLPLNKEKLEGMINAATDIKDLCGVTEGIIDLTAMEEEMSARAGECSRDFPAPVDPNVHHAQASPGMLTQQSAHQPVMVSIAQNGSSIATSTGNVTFVNSASSQLQFIQQRQQHQEIPYQSTPPFQPQHQTIPAGQNLAIQQQGQPNVTPQQSLILNQLNVGGQLMPTSQINSPVLTAQLQQPRLVVPPAPPGTTSLVIQQGKTIPHQQMIMTQQGPLTIQSPQPPANTKSPPVFVLQRGDTLKLDPSGNLVVVPKDDGRVPIPPPATASSIIQPSSSIQRQMAPVQPMFAPVQVQMSAAQPHMAAGLPQMTPGLPQMTQGPSVTPATGALPLPPLQQMRPTMPPRSTIVKPVTTIAAVNLPPFQAMPRLVRPPSAAITSLATSNQLHSLAMPPPASPMKGVNIHGGVKPVQVMNVIQPGTNSKGNMTPISTSTAIPQNLTISAFDAGKPEGILAEALNAPKSAYLDSASGLHLAASGLVQKKDLPNSQGQALLAKLAQPQIMQAITNAANSIKTADKTGTNPSHQTPKQIRIVYRSSSQANQAKAGSRTNEPKKVTLFSCSVCTKIFLRKDSYEQHLFTHYSSNSCPDCPRKFISPEQLQAHQKVCPKNKSRNKFTNSFSCGHCGQKFKFSRDLSPHTNVAHPGLPVKALYHSVINTGSGQSISSTPITVHEAPPLVGKHSTPNNVSNVQPIVPPPTHGMSETLSSPWSSTSTKTNAMGPASVGGIPISTVIKMEKDTGPVEKPARVPKFPPKLAEKDDDWAPPLDVKKTRKKYKIKKLKYKKVKRLQKQPSGTRKKVIPKYLLNDEVQPGYPMTKKVNCGDDFYGGILIQKDPECTQSILLKRFGGQKGSGSRPFTCKLCPKDFFSEHCLFEHIKIHVKPFTCGECGLANARKDNIMKHIQLVHQGPKYKTRDKRKPGFGEESTSKKARLSNSSSSSSGGNPMEEIDVESDSELPTMVQKPSRLERLERRHSTKMSRDWPKDDVIDQLTYEAPEGTATTSVMGATGASEGAAQGEGGKVISGGIGKVSDQVSSVNGRGSLGGDMNDGKTKDENDDNNESDESFVDVMSPVAAQSDCDHQYAVRKDPVDSQQEAGGDMVVPEQGGGTDGGKKKANGSQSDMQDTNKEDAGQSDPQSAGPSDDNEVEAEDQTPTTPSGTSEQTDEGKPSETNGTIDSSDNDNNSLNTPSQNQSIPDEATGDVIEKIDDTVLGAKADEAMDADGEDNSTAGGAGEGNTRDLSSKEREDLLGSSTITVSTLFCSEEGDNIDEGDDKIIDPADDESMPTDVIEIVLSEPEDDGDESAGGERSVIPHIVSVRSLTKEQASELHDDTGRDFLASRSPGVVPSPFREPSPDVELNNNLTNTSGCVEKDRDAETLPGKPDVIDRIKDTLVPVYSPSGSTVLGYKDGSSSDIKNEAASSPKPVTPDVPATTAVSSARTMTSTSALPTVSSAYNPYMLNQMRPPFQRPSSPRMSNHPGFFPGFTRPTRGMFAQAPTFMANPYLRHPPPYPGMGFVSPSLRGLASMRPPGSEFMEKHASMFMQNRMPFMVGRMPFPMQPSSPREGVALSFPPSPWMSPFFPRAPVWVQQPSVSPSVATSPLDLSSRAKSPKGATVTPAEEPSVKEIPMAANETSPKSPLGEPPLPKLIRGDELGKYRTKNGFLPHMNGNRPSSKGDASPVDPPARSPVVQPSLPSQLAVGANAQGPVTQPMDLGPLPVHRFSLKQQTPGFYPAGMFPPPLSPVLPIVSQMGPTNVGPHTRLPYPPHLPRRHSPRLEEMVKGKPYPSWRAPQPSDFPPFPRKRFRRSAVRDSSTGDDLSSSSSSSSPCKRSPRRRSSVGDRPFKCPVSPCKKAFKRPHFLQEHISNHAKAGEIDSSHPDIPQMSRKIKTLVSSPDGEVEVEVDLERPFICHICSKGFKRKNNLADHVRTHSRPYKCGECSFDTIRWQYLAEHMKKAHNFVGDEKELEALFKQSGKKLKPTDIIPLSAMTPITERIKNGRIQDMTGVYMWRHMRVAQSKSKRLRSLKTMKRRKKRRAKNDLVDFYGNSGLSSERSTSSDASRSAVREIRQIANPAVLADGAPYEDDGFIADDSVSQSTEGPSESPVGPASKMLLKVKKEQDDPELMFAESQEVNAGSREGSSTAENRIFVSSEAEDIRGSVGQEGGDVIEKEGQLLEDVKRNVAAHPDALMSAEDEAHRGKVLDEQDAAMLPLANSPSPDQDNAMGSGSMEVVPAHLDDILDDRDSIDDLIDPRPFTDGVMSQRHSSVSPTALNKPRLSTDVISDISYEEWEQNSGPGLDTKELQLHPTTSVQLPDAVDEETLSTMGNGSTEDNFEDHGGDPVVVACPEPTVTDGDLAPTPVEHEVNNNWLGDESRTSQMSNSSTSGTSSALDSSTLSITSAEMVGKTPRRKRKRKKGKHRWSRVKHRGSSYSSKNLTHLTPATPERRGQIPNGVLEGLSDQLLPEQQAMPSCQPPVQEILPVLQPMVVPRKTKMKPSGSLFTSPLHLEQYFVYDPQIPDRPFRCSNDSCDKGFKNKQHMREHIFTHIKPYKCDVCGVGFPRTDYLALHMKDVHKVTPTKDDLFEKRKLANKRAMACRRRRTKSAKRKALHDSMI